MKQRELICISPKRNALPALMRSAMPDWAIHVIDGLDAAAYALREHRFLVGVLDDVIAPEANLHALDVFLREHKYMSWIGVLRPGTVEQPACRTLVASYLDDYYTHPLEQPALLAHSLGHAHGRARLRDGGPCIEAAPMGLTGTSPAIQRLRRQIAKVAGVNAPVLICGESGSGKEVTARAIHDASARAGGPFVAINCGAIASTLIQSELFGHERGAFTGATKAKAGLIETAAGGTIFLDEIADLPRELQANLLRFLQEKTIYRIGATRSLTVDVRVVAASHINLQSAVADGAFREDLFYRLNVLPIEVPPLRERRGDIAPLAIELFHTFASADAGRVMGFSSCAMNAMLEHDWPGNVRELINRIRYAMVMSDGRLVTAADLGLGPAAPAQPDELDDTRERAERQAMLACLARTGHNVSRAARCLGVSRTTMYRLMTKHAISR